MRTYTPTLGKIISSLIIIFFFMPIVQLSEPECRAYGLTSAHGDGPQSIACHEGPHTLFSYMLLSTRGTVWSNQNAEVFKWELHASPQYPFLLFGSLGVYGGVCFLYQLFTRYKKHAKRDKREDR